MTNLSPSSSKHRERTSSAKPIKECQAEEEETEHGYEHDDFESDSIHNSSD